MVQDAFLETLKVKSTPVSIFLVSGIQLIGCIDAHDDYTIALASDTERQLIYKQQIATILPNNSAKNTREKRRNRLFR